jgi:hypothetical protein
MTVQSDMALLAAASYADTRNLRDNRSPIPSGWTELEQYAMSGSGNNASPVTAGFSAKVFKNTTTGEIVISFAGTEVGNTGAGLLRRASR